MVNLLYYPVADNGPGIPADVISHVFEPFFTTKAVGKGTGMGLATVKGIVEQHGAEMSVETNGQGTTFITRWHEYPYVPNDTKELFGVEKTMSYRILLTDDEPLLRKVGVAMLKQLGHTVIEAKDGLEALDILMADLSFDLLMTDLVMPGGISGEQLAAEALVVKPDLKIIYLSGYTDNRNITTNAESQNIHFLAKPFKLDQLREALKKRFSLQS